jgi:hypothetical protein
MRAGSIRAMATMFVTAVVMSFATSVAYAGKATGSLGIRVTVVACQAGSAGCRPAPATNGKIASGAQGGTATVIQTKKP